MASPKLILEVAPDQHFFPNVRKRFVCHINPESIQEGTLSNYSEVLPPGGYISFPQFISSDEEDITFSILLNEFGPDFEDLNPIIGHMNVKDSLDWLTIVQKPIFLGKNKAIFNAPPVLMMIFGSNPVIKVLLKNAKKTWILTDPSTARPIRAEVSITLKKYRKIGL